MDILQFKKVSCKNCFKCLRECPVKSIAFHDNHAEILSDDCLLCGHCLTVCPQNAKQPRDDTPLMRSAIASGARVVASVAPSFIAAFPVGGFAAFTRALRSLGFTDAEETALGARIVADEYQRLLRERGGETLISSACPVIVRFVEKEYPSLLPLLAPVLSPMTAHARLLRERYGAAARIVFIGPCLCKKDEATWEEGAVDCALTFEELSGWLDEAGVRFEAQDESPQPDKEGVTFPAGPCARLFPAPGGILRSMEERLPGVFYTFADGIGNCRRILDELLAAPARGCFLEMNACEGGCVCGPCMPKQAAESRLPGRLAAQRAVEGYAGRRAAEKDTQFPSLRAGALRRGMRAQYRDKSIPGERAIREILARTGKFAPEDELNCGACGYSTCREKAVAVYQGKAEVSMCMPYMRERAEYISDKVIAFTPNAIVAMDGELRIEAVNNAACALFRIDDARLLRGRHISELTEPEPFEEAVIGKKNILARRCCLFRYGVTVELSVVYVREHNFVFGVFRDLTESELQAERLRKARSETAETADRVIENQMRVVQEIAMLLGETTAQTKVALSRLKTVMRDGEA